MNIIDIAIILILIMFGIVGLKKGIIKQGVSLIGIIVVFIIAFIFKEHIGNILCKYLPFFSYGGSLKGIVSINILVYQLIAFLLIFSLLLSIYNIVLKLSGGLQRLVNMTIILLIPSKIGGFLLGLIEGYLYMYTILILVMIPLKDSFLFTSSTLPNKIIYETPIVSKQTASLTSTISEIYDLGADLATNKLSANEADIKIIDSMIKHKLVTPKTIEQLIVLDKLKDVEGIESITQKYK